ncbi:MAG: hypothetical protein LZF61_06670 [Nitrosomonas sp.]|nr:MAG: hypothetical protein LZF61_06670 [Nitrosomonas sp.]
MSKKLKPNLPEKPVGTENNAALPDQKAKTIDASDPIHKEKPRKATASLDKIAAEHSVKKEKSMKIKMIRDSYTMPESDHAKLTELKKKCLESGIHVKKSELLRAGLLRLSKLNKPALLRAIAQVEILKTGRPTKN